MYWRKGSKTKINRRPTLQDSIDVNSTSGALNNLGAMKTWTLPR
jgi:hypothetical protein